MIEPLRVGLIGAGTISQLAHLPATDLADDVRVEALCDRRPRLLQDVAHRHHIEQTYTTAEGLLADDAIEAVGLCVPTMAHDELARLALSRGRHVLCEKPMASTVERGKWMVAAAAEAGKRLMIGHHKRYDPGCEQAADAIGAGAIGRPALAIYHFGTGNWTHPAPRPVLTTGEPAPPWDYDYPAGVDAAPLRAYYVSLLEMFTHITNLVRWLMGDPDWILAAQPAAGVVRGTLTLGWGQEAMAAQAFCVDGPHYAADTWNEVLTVWGDEGRVEVTLPQNVYVNKPARVRLFDAATGRDTVLPEVYGWAFAREWAHFAQRVRSGEPFGTSAEDSLKDLQIAEAAAGVAAGLRPVPSRMEYTPPGPEV